MLPIFYALIALFIAFSFIKKVGNTSCFISIQYFVYTLQYITRAMHMSYLSYSRKRSLFIHNYRSLNCMLTVEGYLDKPDIGIT